MKNFTIGQRVEKLGSAKDYATGRRGIIVEIPNGTNAIEPDRVRVSWDTPIREQNDETNQDKS